MKKKTYDINILKCVSGPPALVIHGGSHMFHKLVRDVYVGELLIKERNERQRKPQLWHII